MRVVALDFETANAHNESACSLGVAIYEDGEFIDNFEWYFKPAVPYNYFTNSHIHHIYKEDVEDCESFVFYYNQLKKLTKDSILIAHNCMFDIGVLNSLCDYYGLDRFPNKYLDTVKISRRVYPELYNHKLDTVAQYLNVDLSHHNAKSDSFACLMILVKAMEAYHSYEVDDFVKKIGFHLHENI